MLYCCLKKSGEANSDDEKTVYADLRFPDAPSKILPTENKILRLKKII